MAKLRSKNRAYNRLATTVSASAYAYGWPTAGSSEPNVVAQWLFDEAALPLVDEVGGISMSIAFHTPVLSTAIPAPFAALTPGADFKGAGTYDGVKNASAQAAIAPNTTSGMVYEFVCTLPYTTALDECFFADYDPDATSRGIQFYKCRGASDLPQVVFKSNDDSLLTISFSSLSALDDGLFHKVRLVLNFAGNAQLFVDGVSYGTASLATLTGKTFNSYQPCIGTNRPGNDYPLQSVVAEFRISANITNNSGGPGGG